MFYQEEMLLQAVRESETAAIRLRQFAATLLRPEYSRNSPVDEIHTGVEVEVTSEGWLRINLPVMLPHRGDRDTARLLIVPLHAAIQSYFRDKSLPKYRACVLVYEHIYDAARARRRVTDHDNLELKHIQDALESAFLANDTALLCSAFQCSHAGTSDSTHIWVLTPDQFPEWLDCHQECWSAPDNLQK